MPSGNDVAPVTDGEVAYVENVINGPWLGPREILARELSKAADLGLRRMDDPENSLYRVKLFEAAKFFKSKRYKTNLVPDIIAAYADTRKLKPKEATLQILEQEEDFNLRVEELTHIKVFALDDYRYLGENEIFIKHESYLRHVEELVNFFLS
tara:strand:- start:139590 stop:140048 length:459 start_codon:yes stop_codon:yes gene_type:complete